MELREDSGSRRDTAAAYRIRGRVVLVSTVVCCTILRAGMTTVAGDSRQVDQGPPELRRSLGKLASELSAAGFPLDLDAVGIRVVADEDMADECYAWLRRDVPNSRTRTSHAVRQALGVKNLPKTAEAALVAEAQGTSLWLNGVFDFSSSTLVFPKRSVEFSTVPKDDVDFLLLHELAHAWQGGRLGIATRAPDETTEDALITQCLVEGQAEVIALLTSLRRCGRGLEGVDPREVFPIGEHAYVAESRLWYSLGTRAFLSAIQATGAASTQDPWGLGYSSTEQVMHPEKVLDQPTQVSLPPPVGQDWDEDTLGELAIYLLLRQLSNSSLWSYWAAGGWDGDRLRWERHGNESTLLWRLVFDRDADAVEFKHAIRKHDEIFVQQHGNRVDLAWATTKTGRDSAAARLSEYPFEHAIDPLDAESAKLIEDAPPWLVPLQYVAVQPTEGGSHGTLTIPSLDVEMRASGDWSFNPFTNLGEMRSDAQRAELTARSTLYLGDLSLDGSKRWLAARIPEPQRDTLKIETVEVSGHEALLAAWRADIDETPKQWYLGLVVLRGARVLWIQVNSTSEPPGEDAREMLLSARFD